MGWIFTHEHPLHLIDLQPNYPHYEHIYDDQDEEEEGDVKPITQEDFRCRPCDRCKQEITWFHRHYYECSFASCHYSLHKFCGELPITLRHTSHSAHTLDLSYSIPPSNYASLQYYIQLYYYICDVCRRHIRGLSYYCSKCKSDPSFGVHAHCAMTSIEDRIIYHPSHQHPLTAILSNPLLSSCNACGKEHKGIFYLCTKYCGFSIHSDCVFQPKKLVIQEATNLFFSHPHPLILCYTFPPEEQSAKEFPKCRICSDIFHDESLWIYKCEKCWYYTHVDCATSADIFSFYGNRLKKNFVESDYPNLLHLPFHDESDSMLKQLFSKNTFRLKDEVRHDCHRHPLILVQKECNDLEMPSSSRSNHVVSCHNPMKKIQQLCNGCVRPIISVPFYKCVNDCCNFVLHEWCTQLPPQLSNYPLHPQHTLILQPNIGHKFFSVFTCSVCDYPCNGFAYSCPQYDCDYHIDIKCGFIPEKITHNAHPGHLLSRVQNKTHPKRCDICVKSSSKEPYLFCCDGCEVWVHIECAMLLPCEIQHSYDKHPMSLTYFPVEDHKSEYFCEICETKFDPKRSFYHCHQCSYSIHPACAPLILQSEAALSFGNHDYKSIYKFLNVKFGGILNAKCHPHTLSFVQGIERDGNCTKCDCSLHYRMIFKCVTCKFVIHLECCESLMKRT